MFQQTRWSKPFSSSLVSAHHKPNQNTNGCQTVMQKSRIPTDHDDGLHMQLRFRHFAPLTYGELGTNRCFCIRSHGRQKNHFSNSSQTVTPTTLVCPAGHRLQPRLNVLFEQRTLRRCVRFNMSSHEQREFILPWTLVSVQANFSLHKSIFVACFPKIVQRITRWIITTIGISAH